MLKLVAPEVGGVKDSAGTWHDADEKLEGGPSVLFDAVAILPSKEGAALLAMLPAARDFIADATAHRKFIAYVGRRRAAAGEGGGRPRTKGSSPSRRLAIAPTSSPPAASSASGTARPPSAEPWLAPGDAIPRRQPPRR